MKKYKGIIILLIVLVIYSLLMFVFFNNKDNQNNNGNENNINTKKRTIEDEKYLVISNTSTLRYTNNSFEKASNSEISKLDNLKVYVNNNFYGNYKMKYVSNWNLFDKNNEFVNYNGNLLAVSNNFNVNVRNYKIREINESDKVFLINNYNINTFNYLLINEVVDIDLDNNGILDEIICLSSMLDSDNDNNYYNIIALKLNNEKVTLIEERGQDALYVYSIFGVINIDENLFDSIIISKVEGFISENPITTNLVYNYKNNNYTID